jgi:hypothetical protein
MMTILQQIENFDTLQDLKISNTAAAILLTSTSLNGSHIPELDLKLQNAHTNLVIKQLQQFTKSIPAKNHS